MIKIVRTYDELIDAFRQRRHEMGISQLEMDERIGWAQGYTGKIEAKPGSRRDGKLGRGNFRSIGPQSLGELLQALGMEIVVMRCGDGLEKFMLSGAKHPAPAQTRQGLGPDASRERMRALGRLGGQRANQSLTARQREIRARRAARARWKRDKKKPLDDGERLGTGGRA